MIKHVRPAVIMMIFSATRKESGSLMIIAATNGSQKRRYIGVTACCSDSLERGEMMEKTYEEVEKTADSLQAAATRKKNLEVAKINSFYDGYIQGIEDLLRSIRQEKGGGFE